MLITVDAAADVKNLIESCTGPNGEKYTVNFHDETADGLWKSLSITK